MDDLNKVLVGFQNKGISEWVSFLNEKINDGAEISRGKMPDEKSKEEKRIENRSDPGEEDLTAADASVANPIIIDPSQAPGSQIAIGKKHTSDEADPKASEIKISGEKEKINLKPVLNFKYGIK